MGASLARCSRLSELGASGVLGSGRQYFSSVAAGRTSCGRCSMSLVDTESLTGPVNLISPHPVTNREFTKTLGRVLSRSTVLPMPAFAARLAIW